MTPNQYNLYNFEAPFRNFLLAEKVSIPTLKNYLSDFRHFSGWFTFYIKNHVSNKPISTDFNQFQLISTSLTEKIIIEYKSYLIENNLPIRTTNRRLSTLRKFCTFCISQGWMKENPAKKVTNVSWSSLRKQGSRNYIDSRLPARNATHSVAGGRENDILTQFESDLIKQNIDQPTITNYLEDIREFMTI